MLAKSLDLIKDPGFSSDYSAVLDFPSITERDDYFTSKIFKSVENGKINVRLNQSVANVNFSSEFISFEDVEKCSYIRIMMNDENFYRYYFITSVETPSNYTISINLERDVWQFAIGKQWSLKNATLNTGHVNRWNRGSTKPILYPFNENIIGSQEKVYSEDIEIDSNMFFVMKWIKKNTELNTVDVQYGICPVSITNDTDYTTGVYLGKTQLTGGLDIYGIPLSSILDGFSPSNYGWEIDPETIVWACVVPQSALTFTLGGTLGSISNGSVLCATSTGVAIEGTQTGATRHFALLSWLVDLPFVGGSYNLTKSTAVYGGVQIPIKPEATDTKSNSQEPMLFRNDVTKRYVVDYSGNVLFTFDDYNYMINDLTKLNIYSTLGSSGVSVRIQTNTNKQIDSSVIGMCGIIQPIMIDVLSNAWTTYEITKLSTDKQLLALNQQTEIVNGALSALGSATSVVSANKFGGADVSKYVSATSAGSGVTAIAGAIWNYHALGKKFDINIQEVKNKSSQILAIGDGAGNCINGFNKLHVVTTRMELESYKALAEKIYRFGYNLGIEYDGNIKSRKYFDYRQLAYANIIGELNTTTKAELLNIFLKGTTIFHMDYCKNLTNIYDAYEQNNIERVLL